MEINEDKHLSETYAIICGRIEEKESELSVRREDLIEKQKSVWESVYDLDAKERAALKSGITVEENFYEQEISDLRHFLKLKKNAYFGRIGFTFDGQARQSDYYIGMFGLTRSNENVPLILDWRAPIASLFYDSVFGRCSYRAPKETIYGNLSLKRQYSIEEDKLITYADITSRLSDDILLHELSRAKSGGMKNIVSTLQSEQNEIIRSNHVGTLVIQGVAGSGKTSVALHRIAFLLFNNRANLSSKDVVILSPNKVFSSYISSVIPEMGEEPIREVSFRDITKRVLDKKSNIETYAGFTERKKSERDKSLIRAKFSLEFYKKYIRFIDKAAEEIFCAQDICLENLPAVEKEIVFKRFSMSKALSVEQKCKEAAYDIWDYHIETNRRGNKAVLKEVERRMLAMLKPCDAVELYNEFLSKLSLPCIDKKNISYEDLAFVAYASLKLKGNEVFAGVKQLIIDEMQDYGYMQYSILCAIFPNAQKTVLGDVNQSLNSFCGCLTAENIASVFSDAKIVRMNKSYRSTYEINSLAKKILRDETMEIVNRHGKEPELFTYENSGKQADYIINKCNEFAQSGYKSLAVLFKDDRSAKSAFIKLSPHIPQACQIDGLSSEIEKPIVFSSIALAKGLEFDTVIVADSDTDKHTLYVAITRALHELYITTPAASNTDGSNPLYANL